MGGMFSSAPECKCNGNKKNNNNNNNNKKSTLNPTVPLPGLTPLPGPVQNQSIKNVSKTGMIEGYNNSTKKANAKNGYSNANAKNGYSNANANPKNGYSNDNSNPKKVNSINKLPLNNSEPGQSGGKKLKKNLLRNKK